jgi:hypothetical protein
MKHKTMNSNYNYTVPNQKVISISGKAPCDTNNLYAKINKEAMFAAIQNLTPSNFEVWLYLASQQNNYTFAFSPSAVSDETGIKKSTLQEGIRVLIRERYLIPRGEKSNVYDFYELPKEDVEEVIEICVNKSERESNTESFNF